MDHLDTVLPRDGTLSHKTARILMGSSISSRLAVVPIHSLAGTPTRSPQKRTMGITESDGISDGQEMGLEIPAEADGAICGQKPLWKCWTPLGDAGQHGMHRINERRCCRPLPN